MKRDFQLASTYNSFLALEEANKIVDGGLMCFEASSKNVLERIYKPHYDYQIFSTLANGTDLNRQKYAILQNHWHQNWSVMELKCP